MPSKGSSKRWVDRTFWNDLSSLLEQRQLGWNLYLADVAEQRKNSGLGLIAPFISIFVHVALLGGVMSIVFSEPLTTFLPFFAISLALWQSISTFVSETANANEKLYRYIYFPNVSGYIVYLISSYEFIVGFILKIASSVIVILFVDYYVLINANYLSFIVGTIILLILIISWALPIALFFDYFRLARGFLPQILFAIYLITPILWDPSRVSSHRWLVEFNPLYHVIETIRSPLLNGDWPTYSLFIVIGLVVLGFASSFASYSFNRNLVLYRWLA